MQVLHSDFCVQLSLIQMMQIENPQPAPPAAVQVHELSDEEMQDIIDLTGDSDMEVEELH
jgi:hypothetical protein